MLSLTIEQARAHRLRAHHLAGPLSGATVADRILAVVGACGMQNTPPGSWEAAAWARVPDCTARQLRDMLERTRVLMQAWSFRGAPVVFPSADADTFLAALIPQGGEPWAYTNGVRLALDYLGMGFEEALDVMRSVMPRLAGLRVVGKATLDQLVADWMEPLVPKGVRAKWRNPSMYGRPDVQTVGGAVVSFLLRPCSFEGRVAFGRRFGAMPTFVEPHGWMAKGVLPHGSRPTCGTEAGEGSHDVSAGAAAAVKGAAGLARAFLHCFAPATPAMFATWLGCSGAQARRMLGYISEETVAVSIAGAKALALERDVESLTAPPDFDGKPLVLAAHDPFLDQRDRNALQPDKALQRRIWRAVGNPGVIVARGEAVGIWRSRTRGRRMDAEIELWRAVSSRDRAEVEARIEAYAAFRGLAISRITFAS